MSDNEILQHMLLSARDVLDFYSNPGKEARERWVVSEFLKVIEFPFKETEIKFMEQSSKIDVKFRDTQLQVKEIVNSSGLMRNASNIASNAVWDNSNNNYAQSVNFDIAVTVDDTAKAGAKVKVVTGIFGVNAIAESYNKNSLTSRVQFSAPILLSPQDIEKLSANKGKFNKTTL